MAYATPPRTPQEACAYALAMIGTTGSEAGISWKGHCEHFAAMCYGYSSGWASAIEHWYGMPGKQKDRQPPAGALCFWAGGLYGHVAISLGDGTIVSTDILRSSKPDRVPFETIEKKWGMRYLGWLPPGQAFSNGTFAKKREAWLVPYMAKLSSQFAGGNVTIDVPSWSGNSTDGGPDDTAPLTTDNVAGYTAMKVKANIVTVDFWQRGGWIALGAALCMWAMFILLGKNPSQAINAVSGGVSKVKSKIPEAPSDPT